MAREKHTVAMTRRRTIGLLTALGLAFALRMAFNAGPGLRSVDEAHFCAAAARIVGDGGPLYGNALVSKGPVLYWFTAGVFRLAGLHNLVALRLATVAWGLATAAALYAAARTLVGRPASLAVAAAFVLAAMNPGFQAIRADGLTCLPLAAAFGLALRGVNRREALSLALAGGAVALAFLTKQQAGLALPAVAGCPLLCWLWPRADTGGARRMGPGAHGPRRGTRPRPGAPRPPLAGAWLGLCGSALVVAGFLAVVGAVWLWYALRGAGHEFLYCVWTYNWAFLERTPAGGYLPSVGFFGRRVVRYVLQEPLLPMAMVAAAAGLAWRGPAEANGQAVPWRARMVSVAGLLTALWLAATPADIPAPSDFSYVTYLALLYVPMCLLVGVAVEVAARGEGSRRVLLVGLVAMGLVHVVVAAFRPIDPVWWRLPLDVTAQAVKLDLSRLGVSDPLRIPGGCFLAGTIASSAVAGWVFGGARLSGLAVALWAALYVSAPGSLGWTGSHLAAAVSILGLSLLWRGSERDSLLLAVAAGLVQAAGCRLDWLPQAGLGIAATVWLWRQPRRGTRERLALAAAYLLPVLAVSVPLAVAQLRMAWGAQWPWEGVPGAVLLLGDWLLEARLPAALALLAILLAGGPAAGRLERWRRAAASPSGLVALAALGSFAGALALGVTRPLLATPGAAVALLGAMALSRLLRADGGVAPRAASWLLVSGCAAAGAAALAIGLRTPGQLKVQPPRQALVDAIQPGSRAYVWGDCFQTDIYVLARAVPAAPQLYTWMMPETQPDSGAITYPVPPLATLSGLDRALAESPPLFLVVGEQMPRLETLPRFGPILRARYRLTHSAKEAEVFQLVAP